MRGIRIKQPRYIIPLLLIPFNAFLFYMFRDSPGDSSNEPTEAQTNVQELKTDIPSPNLERLPLKNKFESFQENFKYNRDFSAIKEIDLRDTKDLPEKEQAMVDSVNDVMISGERKSFMTRVQERTNSYMPDKNYKPQPVKQDSDYEIQMRLFKEQMRYIDSLNRASEVPEMENRSQETNMDTVTAELAYVSKNPPSAALYFNTIKPIGKDQLIKAIIDEDIKVFPGSRVRIRLLEDIYVGEQLIEKGNYLYGIVTSFKPQRLEISVATILVKGQIIEVDLQVYDNDGLSGLYVPESRFREFTKDLTSNAVSGQNFQFSDTPENKSEMLYDMAKKAFSTTTKTVSKAARKNKAKLKYNTVLYLVNSNEHN